MISRPISVAAPRKARLDGLATSCGARSAFSSLRSSLELEMMIYLLVHGPSGFTQPDVCCGDHDLARLDCVPWWRHSACRTRGIWSQVEFGRVPFEERLLEQRLETRTARTATNAVLDRHGFCRARIGAAQIYVILSGSSYGRRHSCQLKERRGLNHG
jgi:hypothetical protein